MLGVYAVLFYYIGYEYVYIGYSMLLGIISFPFLIQTGAQKMEFGYLIVAIVSSLGAWWSGSFSLFYFTFAFGACFILNAYLGQINKLPIVLLLLVSPLVSHLSAMLSFPIRLQLSAWVSKALSTIGFDIVSEGNLLIISGARFLVDQECVGLKMLITGMVLILIILAFFERKHKRQYTLWQIGLALAVGLLFNILANFSRILVLVLFQIGPERIMHEVVGILCLLAYNTLPLIFVVMRLTPRGPEIVTTPNKISWRYNPNFILPLLFGLLYIGGQSTLKESLAFADHIQNPLLEDLSKEQMDFNILKYSNDDLLVYVKPPASPFRGTHDPRFCWRGSGYELTLIKEEMQNGHLIYTGELVKGKDKLYTAWWYQDGASITNSEWSWRTKSVLDAKAFSLININADSKAELVQATRKYLNAL